MEEMLQVPTEKQRIQSKRDEVQHAQQQAQLNPDGAPAPPSPSPSSSPSHDFSFTIPPENRKTHSSPSPPPSAAVDLSPADEIFFRGHLLPLHLLPPLPAPPRASVDSFTLPIKDFFRDKNDGNRDDSNNNKSNSTRSTSDDDDEDCSHESRHVLEAKNKGKSKSFSLFGNTPKWKKLGFDSKEEFEDIQNQKIKSKSKSRFEFLKRYVGLILPFLSNRGRGDPEFRRRRYSYSGNLRFRSRKDLRGRRGEFSAPATMKTSPANSGILVTASGAVTPTGKSDSTMEELQAAIQAAIAHCKNSIATKDQNQAAMKS